MTAAISALEHHLTRVDASTCLHHQGREPRPGTRPPRSRPAVRDSHPAAANILTDAGYRRSTSGRGPYQRVGGHRWLLGSAMSNGCGTIPRRVQHPTCRRPHARPGYGGVTMFTIEVAVRGRPPSKCAKSLQAGQIPAAGTTLPRALRQRPAVLRHPTPPHRTAVNAACSTRAI